MQSPARDPEASGEAGAAHRGKPDPQGRAQKDRNRKITYLYTDGTKVQKLVKTNAAAGVTTNYISGFQYKGTTLEFFPVSGGYVKSTVVGGVNNYNYVFHYLDHLGNIRLSYAKNVDTGVKILEENHYYPKQKNYKWLVVFLFSNPYILGFKTSALNPPLSFSKS